MITNETLKIAVSVSLTLCAPLVAYLITENHSLEKQFLEYKLEAAEKYATREDLKDSVGEIKEKLDTIFEQLNDM